MKFSKAKEWEDKIIQSRKEKKEWMDQFRVELARAYFEGQQKPDHIAAHDWITLNMIYSHLMAQLPALYSVDPYFYVKLKKSYTPDPNVIPQFEQKGKIRQDYLNYLKGELKLKSKARLGIQDAHFAFGVLKSFYVADFKENEKAGETIVDELGNPVLDEQGNEMVQPDVIPVNGRYSIKRVDPDNFIFDCDAGPLEDSWNWLGEEFVMPMKEVRQDRRFSKKVVKQIEGRLKTNRTKTKDAGASINIEEELVTFVEIWDIKNKEWLIYCDYADDLAMPAKPHPKAVENHPYSILRFVLKHKSALPIPPMSQGLDPQREYNMARSDVMVHRKRFNRKYEVNVNALTSEEELSKLESGDDGTIIQVQQIGAVKAISDANMDPSRYTEIAALKNDMVELLGSPEAARGIAGADSATEASILDARMEVKEGDRLSIVVDWLTDAAEKLDKLVQCHIEKEEAVKVTGPEGEYWQVVTPQDYEEISGDFQYSVNIGSTQARLPHIERSQWIAFMTQVILPMPQILTKPNLMKKFAMMFGIEDESLLEEFRQLGLELIQNPPQAQGSAPGVSEVKPEAVTGGQVGGLLNFGG